MAAITIRNLEDETKAKLKLRAAQHGRSMEAEARAILEDVTSAPTRPQNIGVALIELGKKFGPIDIPREPYEETRNPFAGWFDEEDES
ncbi:MAG: FitA-like ribbon-helix-helix domain-containing protein [Solirubrobacterales bacterium]